MTEFLAAISSSYCLARREFAGDDADNREFFDASMASLIRTLHAELRAR